MNNKFYHWCQNVIPSIRKGWKAFWVSIRYLFDYQTTMKASALTYFTLLSIVPIVALVFAIAKNFGMEQVIQQEIIRHLSGQEAVMNWVIKLANSIIHKAKSGILAGVGLVLLFWAILRLLVNMENAFNDIWQVRRGRSIGRKFADYTAIIVLSPIVLILSMSFTIYLSTKVELWIKFKYIKPFVGALLGIIPYALLWLLFTVLYKAMPNTRVKARSAIIAGILTGSLFQIIQWIYVQFQIGVSNLNALYGSFAALPLFMIWVQTSWLVVLVGGHFCYTLQNFEKLEFEKDVEKISNRYRNIIALLIVHYIVQKFVNQEIPPTAEEISEENQLPARVVRQLLNQLEEVRIVAPTPVSNEAMGYFPAVDIQKLTVLDVINRLDQLGINNLPIAEGKGIGNITQALDKISEHIYLSNLNMLVKDIMK
ncbi:MAG: YihY/virulence factor BrkB family protein [Bacteroidales bacterium]|nr:YihY/virulence factor BrkB family protein [Bacteroidales bacterium]